METIVITRKKFVENLETYFKLIENGKQVVLKWGKNKAFVTPAVDEDAFFTPQMIEEIKESLDQADKGNVIKPTDKEWKEWLGL
jgi:hypothetical protein